MGRLIKGTINAMIMPNWMYLFDININSFAAKCSNKLNCNHCNIFKYTKVKIENSKTYDYFNKESIPE